MTPLDLQRESEILEINQVKTAEQFDELVLKVKKNTFYTMVVFLSANQSLPADWMLNKFTKTPYVVFIGIKEKKLLSIYNYLETVGIMSTVKSSDQKYDNLLPSIINYLHENIHDSSFNLLTVSNQFNISSSYLSKIFKKYYGIGFKQYLIRQRINKAKLMLQYGFSVTYTCEKVGYGDLTHFSKTFKKMEGISPLNYKKQFYLDKNEYEK
ncbi:AraC-type DNA-binding protein [Fictibacillus solisalsi]|uniref:AraC-type DNA-binding protein n=1 Tax=Fictibacillus solisalsi TaxID=459525 RepID=A0A1H0BQN6_9BACL|nr:AraC family transcriptional regulator [Fictibacillus solisalsi]SDN47936.1 AraC-type DNA-binding protein [Fictibacillus solisalsi]